MKNRLLLIIDPQIDFITGSLPVPGAEQAMNLLSEYLRSNSCDYTHVIVTADRHPSVIVHSNPKAGNGRHTAWLIRSVRRISADYGPTSRHPR